MELDFPWHLLADNELMPPPRLNPDETFRSEVTRAISIAGPLRDTQDLSFLVLAVSVNEAPMNLAYEFFLRSGTQSWRMGALVFVKGETTSARLEADLPSLPDNAVVDVVLSPSPATAREPWETEEFRMGNRLAYSSITEIWGGEVAFSDIPVERRDLSQSKERARRLRNKR